MTGSDGATSVESPERQAPTETRPASSGGPAPRPTAGRFGFLGNPLMQQSWTAIAFAVLFAVFAVWLGPGFLDGQARILDIHQSAAIILLAAAAVTTLVTGHFDLSITGMSTLSVYLVVGLVVRDGLGFWPAVVIALAVGVVGGLVNGILIEKVRVHAFIATLASGAVLTGISAVYSDGQQISPTVEGPFLPEWFSGQGSFGSYAAKAPQALVWVVLAGFAVWAFFQIRRFRPRAVAERRWDLGAAAALVVAAAALFGAGLVEWVGYVSWTLIFVVVVITALWIMLRYTAFGRHLKATGANPTAARLAGVDTTRMGILAYVISGTLASLSGVLMAANLGAASAEGAASYLLPAFSAAFLSTVLFSPGQFTIWGAVAGSVMIVWITQALAIGGLVFTWAAVVNGLILILAVALSSIARRRTT